ncbi:hypothetical protein ACOSQ2_006116 [Xanthoceras sorbifolium]
MAWLQETSLFRKIYDIRGYAEYKGSHGLESKVLPYDDQTVTGFSIGHPPTKIKAWRITLLG